MADEYRTRLQTGLCPEWKLSTAMEPCMSQRTDQAMWQMLWYKAVGYQGSKRRGRSWGSQEGKWLQQVHSSVGIQQRLDTRLPGSQSSAPPTSSRGGQAPSSLPSGGVGKKLWFPGKWCTVQGKKDYRSDNKEAWQGTMALWILSTANPLGPSEKLGQLPMPNALFAWSFLPATAFHAPQTSLLPPGHWIARQCSPKLMNKIVQNLKEMRIRKCPSPSGAEVQRHETKPLYHTLASAQDERVHLKGIERGISGPLVLSSLTITGLKKMFLVGEQKEPRLWVWIPRS